MECVLEATYNFMYTKSPGHVYTVYTPGLSYIFIKLVFQRLSAHLLQQLRFNLIKLIRKVHINLMRVHETLRLIPEGVLLLRADITDFHNGRRRVYTLAALEYRNKKFSQGIGVGVDLCLFPGLQRIEDDHILLIIEGLVSQADEIGADLAGLAVVDPVDGLVARVRDLLGVLGKLDLRDKFSCL